jgi:hypothetical protein
MLIEKYTR